MAILGLTIESIVVILSRRDDDAIMDDFDRKFLRVWLTIEGDDDDDDDDDASSLELSPWVDKYGEILSF